MSIPKKCLMAMIACLVFHGMALCQEFHQCNPANPPTLQNVALNEISGRWFINSLGSHVPHEELKRRLYLNDYNMDIANDSRTVIENGRQMYEPQGCVYDIVEYIPTANQSTWRAYIHFGSKEVEYRLLDTDRKSYLLFWICLDISQILCKDWAVYTMTRIAGEDLPESTLEIIQQSIADTVCDMTLYRKKFDERGVCKRYRGPI